METEFIYWRHHTLPGIKVEEVCGGEDRPLPLWTDMAYQIYCENGKDGYREIGHFRNGAPFLAGDTSRISITHTGRFLAVATLPPTPEAELGAFSERAALGIDAEPASRQQTVKVRDKYLSDEEKEMIPPDDLTSHVLAWTAKEAAFKAALTPGLDFRADIRIKRLPKIGPAVPVYDKNEFDPIQTGEALVIIEGKEVPLVLYSYESEGNIVTLAYSPKCAKFGN